MNPYQSPMAIDPPRESTPQEPKAIEYFDRGLMIVVLVVFPLWVSEDVFLLSDESFSWPRLIMGIGLLLQPVSVIGLWKNRLWGVVLLIIGSVMSGVGVLGAVLVFSIAQMRLTRARRLRRRRQAESTAVQSS